MAEVAVFGSPTCKTSLGGCAFFAVFDRDGTELDCDALEISRDAGEISINW